MSATSDASGTRYGGKMKVAGDDMYALAKRLFPICRSITGNGLRETLRLVGREIPLELTEVPTGTDVLDWTIPREWNITDAWIVGPDGDRIVDFKESNLHVVNYSSPVRQRLQLEELRTHLHTLPDQPDLIPYRTSYYHENWGFCLSHRQYEQLKPGEYEVCIESSLTEGSLTYGELVLPGETDDTVLFSCHCCHPSLANDNLSGIALCTYLAKTLVERPRRYTYRFLFIPGTIGAITWLARNQRTVVPRIAHGLVVACVGDPGPMTYKRSRRGKAEIDRAVELVLKEGQRPHTIVSFSPYGYDERQFNSPGFNLPVGSLTRTPHGQYPQYHTSADNLDLIAPEWLQASLETYLHVCDVLESNRHYLNTSPYGEPQLGKRGLYDRTGGYAQPRELQSAMLWVLNYSDGDYSLLDIAERSGLPFAVINEAARLLRKHELLREK